MLVIPATTDTTATYAPANTFLRAEKYVRGFVQYAPGQIGFVRLYVWPLDAAYGPQPLPEFRLVTGVALHHYASFTVPEGGQALAGIACRSQAAGRTITFYGALYTERETYGKDSLAVAAGSA